MELRIPRTSVSIGDTLYPRQLLDLPDPPETLRVSGNPEVLSLPSLAIVGARRCTPYGHAIAAQVANAAVEAGMPVVTSGGIGIATMATSYAVAEDHPAIVVLGCGLSTPYPLQNATLFEEVFQHGGCIVSEHPDDMPPRPYAFRSRNRIIAALAAAMVVVECGMPSGTFSTCDDALSLGRLLYAVPGQITSTSSEGCNSLIADGQAACIDDVGRLEHYLHELLDQEGDNRHV